MTCEYWQKYGQTALQWASENGHADTACVYIYIHIYIYICIHIFHEYIYTSTHINLYAHITRIISIAILLITDHP